MGAGSSLDGDGPPDVGGVAQKVTSSKVDRKKKTHFDRRTFRLGLRVMIGTGARRKIKYGFPNNVAAVSEKAVIRYASVHMGKYGTES